MRVNGVGKANADVRVRRGAWNEHNLIRSSHGALFHSYIYFFGYLSLNVYD